MPLPLNGERLILRAPEMRDASMVLKLFNQPDSLKYIGDRGIRSLEDAEKYIEKNMLSSFRANGFCLFTMELIHSGEVVGICGLIKRDGLDDIDLGFGQLTEHQSKGYVTEAAKLCISFATEDLGLSRLVAICDPDNAPSIRLLEKQGFKYDQPITMGDEGKAIALYSLDLSNKVTDS